MTEIIIALLVIIVVKLSSLGKLGCVSRMVLQIRAHNNMFGLVVIDNSSWMMIDSSTDIEGPLINALSLRTPL